jgi:alkylation response protein AidB-like acyl-CoA dehydrogenase
LKESIMNRMSETQEMLSKAVEQMLEKHNSAQSICDGNPKPDLWSQLVELGLTAAEFPLNRGGLAVPFTDIAPAFRKIGRALATTYLKEFITMGGWLVGACEKSSAGDIASLAVAGEARVVLASGEYGSGGDVRYTKTRAVQAEDGWKINGKKAVVVGGDRATHLIVLAKIAPIAGDPNGELALFLLPVDALGVTSHVFELYDGSIAADFNLRDVKVSADNLLAQGKKAVDLIDLALDRGRAALCHETFGLLEKVHEITLEYVKTRKQFGQPIGAFQTMQHRMANMYMDIELAQSCAELATDAISSRSEANGRMQTISAAMVSICECARRVGQSAVQAHGGIALTQEYLVGHYFKRLTMVERYLGNTEYHAERYIAYAEA